MKPFNKLKPTVFLDIDGVLNHQRFTHACFEAGGRRCMDALDKESIAILNEIHDWNFVLSSTWRRSRPLEVVEKVIKDQGFLGEFCSKTPVFNESWSCRGNEIDAWIDENIPYQDQDMFDASFVIFDDDSDMLLKQQDNFFAIDNCNGISSNVIYRAKRFLRRNPLLEVDSLKIGEEK